MKGIISAILLIAMALSLWGCASEEKTDGTTKDTSPADDCAHLYVEDVTKSASCTENGIKTFACSLCGDSYTEDIPAAGHQEEAGKCTVCGEKNKYYKELTDGDWVHHVLGESDQPGKAASVEEYCLDFQNERFCYWYYEEASALPTSEPDLIFLEREWVNIPLGAPWADFASVTESENTITIQMTCMESATMVLERISHNKLQVVSIQGQTIPDAEGIIRVGTIFNFKD